MSFDPHCVHCWLYAITIRFREFCTLCNAGWLYLKVRLRGYAR